MIDPRSEGTINGIRATWLHGSIICSQGNYRFEEEEDPKTKHEDDH